MRKFNLELWGFFYVDRLGEYQITSTKICKRPASTADYRELLKMLPTKNWKGVGYKIL